MLSITEQFNHTNMDAETMLSMTPLEVLKMLRAQVEMAIALVESNNLIKDSSLSKSISTIEFLIGDFKISPRFD